MRTDLSFRFRPHRPGHAFKCAVGQFGDQEPVRIDWTGHDRAVDGMGLKPHLP